MSVSVSVAGSKLKRNFGGNLWGQESFGRHQVLQAGPRSEELTGEASRVSIASAINTAHVEKGELRIKASDQIISVVWSLVK